MKIPIYQVDAFASELFKGNPAAVCPLDEWLPDQIMQNIAMENNLSETAFFLEDNGFFQIRWFTPKAELDLAGHPTLATAHIILNEFNLKGVDQIIYSFLHLKGNELAIDNEADSISLIGIVDQKEKYPNLKVLVSLGGWGGCKTCSDIFNTKEGRVDFAKSTARIIEEYNADGIDLDWEYPAIPGPPGHPFREEDKDNFTDLIKLLREYMKPGDILSFAAGGFKSFIDKSVDWDIVTPLIDNVNLMSYDLIGGYSKVTGHHTSLYSTENQERSGDYAVKYLKSKGVPANKIVLGAAFYGRIYKDVANINNGLYQAANFKGGVNQNNFDEVTKDFEFFWDETAQAPYAYQKENQLFLTYDNKKSIKLKSNYVKENGLHGIMFWQLMNDKRNDGLLKVMVNSIKEKE